MTYMSHDQVVAGFSEKSVGEVAPDPRNITVPLTEFFNWEEIEKFEDRYRPSDFMKSAVPQAVDLRNFDCEIEEQEGPRCTAWALSHAMSNMITQKTGEKSDLSEAHVWSKYGKYSCAAAITALSKIENRVCDEMYWPSVGSNRKSGIEKNKHAWVKSYRYIGNNVIKMQDALAQGKVVYLAAQVPADMSAGRAVIRPDSKATSGGHALVIVGYKRDDSVPGGIYAILKNSWGKRTGDLGYQYFPIAYYAQRRDMYVQMWVLEEVASERGVEVPVKEKKCVKWVRPWYAPWKRRCVQYESL